MKLGKAKNCESGNGSRVRNFFFFFVCVCVCVCACVSHDEEKVPDEWQEQAIPATLQVSSSKHNAKRNTTRVRGPFHQSITATLTEEKEWSVRVIVLVAAARATL